MAVTSQRTAVIGAARPVPHLFILNLVEGVSRVSLPDCPMATVLLHRDFGLELRAMAAAFAQ